MGPDPTRHHSETHGEGLELRSRVEANMYDDDTVIGDTHPQSATTLPVTTDFSGQQLPNNYLYELVVESNILLLQMLNINYLKINMANFKLKPHSLE